MLKILIILFLLLILKINLHETIDNTSYFNSEDNECCLKKIEDKSKLFHHYEKIKCDDKLKDKTKLNINKKEFPLNFCNYYNNLSTVYINNK
tara:strand:- start:7508 stop:7783 length:276 start_codon:yes stop_codon:yes gene_type:complete